MNLLFYSRPYLNKNRKGKERKKQDTDYSLTMSENHLYAKKRVQKLCNVVTWISVVANFTSLAMKRIRILLIGIRTRLSLLREL